MSRRVILDYAEEACEKWSRFVAEMELGELLDPYAPLTNAIGFKVADEVELFQTLARFFECGDQVHIAPVDDRSIATIRLASTDDSDGARHIKILQRRPGRDDPLGLEHLDILLAATRLGEAIDLETLGEQLLDRRVNCELERNEAHVWLSLHYDGFEFKLVDRSVWNICVQEATAALDQGTPSSLKGAS